MRTTHTMTLHAARSSKGGTLTPWKEDVLLAVARLIVVARHATSCQIQKSFLPTHLLPKVSLHGP